MRRIALVFLVAVFAPSLGLGFLALRTAGEQRGILERQAAELYQNDTDALAAAIRAAVLERQRAFAARVRERLSTTPPAQLAPDFARALGDPAGAAFVVTPAGDVPAPADPDQEDAALRRETREFVRNRAPAELFPVPQTKTVPKPALGGTRADATAAAPAAAGAERKVQPQRNAPAEPASRLVSQIADFRTATAGDRDGVLARYTRNELELILWTRPPEAEGYLFGLALPAAAVADLVRAAFAAAAPGAPDACLAVLDETARPVAQSVPGFTAEWKRPFVASEIGETLPHWETALYLRDPERLARSAELITLTIILLIALALAAILAGGSFVALDARRQLVLARQKTDFVSNVSHELKTPLTSIRLFAEMLERDSAADPAKRANHLRIIRLESERLTRLINNVLDFARLEKGRRPLHPVALDLNPVVARTWEAQCIHLQAAGFSCTWSGDPPPYPARAVADAVEQILVNLLSNAEKYSGDRREITLRTTRAGAEWLVAVEDRGIGVPPGEELRIFHAFHRAHDSLASGVPGSGLGLTLADRLARDQGGRITFTRRADGGSIFTLHLPAAA